MQENAGIKQNNFESNKKLRNGVREEMNIWLLKVRVVELVLILTLKLNSKAN